MHCWKQNVREKERGREKKGRERERNKEGETDRQAERGSEWIISINFQARNLLCVHGTLSLCNLFFNIMFLHDQD